MKKPSVGQKNSGSAVDSAQPSPASKESELVIRYNPTPGWFGKFFSRAAIFFCLAALYAAYCALHEGEGAGYAWLLNILARPMAGLFAAGPYLVAAFFASALAIVTEEDRIRMSKGGIEFPPYMGLDLLLKLKRRWTDIGAVSLEVEERDELPEDGKEGRSIVFHFASGGKARIPMAALSPEDLNTFFRASKRWGSTAVIAPDLIDLRRKLLAGPTYLQSGSVIKLWQDEMEACFTATNFVPLEIGSNLQNGHFRIISQITAGGLSAVYLAQKQDGRKVVLKELVLPESEDSSKVEKARQLFEREASLLIKLRHPQIAHVYDQFRENGRDYLVLNYIPGQSLRQYVRTHGPVSEDTAIEWGSILAEILEYLHGQEPPVLHRDLTPDNVVISPEGKLYLIDFGAANEIIGTATGTLVGKQSFIAPEQFRGHAERASDLYALGGSLYFLVTGHEPEPLSLALPRSHRDFISLEFDALVASLTRQDPEDRPKSAQDLIVRFSELRSAERTAAIKIKGKSGK